MAELLKVLSEWLLFFFKGNRYHLTRSETSESFGNALIELESDSLRWRLERDRSEIVLTCRPTQVKLKSYEWFSADLLVRLITGERIGSALLTREMSVWIESNLDEIEGRFSPPRIQDTLAELHALERLRAKELFG